MSGIVERVARAADGVSILFSDAPDIMELVDMAILVDATSGAITSEEWARFSAAIAKFLETSHE